jgi:hypothetical protein
MSEVQRLQARLKILEDELKSYKEVKVPYCFCVVKSENSETQWAAYDYDKRIIGTCMDEDDAQTLLALVQAFRTQKEPVHQTDIDEESSRLENV